MVKNCRWTQSGQGCGLLFDCQGDEWQSRYARLCFPLVAPHWLPRRTPTAAARTSADPSAFLPAPTNATPSWTLNWMVEFLQLIRLGVCADYLYNNLEKGGMCSFPQTTPIERSLVFPQSNNKRNPLFSLSPLLSYSLDKGYVFNAH